MDYAAREADLRVLTWNLAKRRDCDSQIRALGDRRPDVAVLQEVTERTWPRIREVLSAVGLPYALASTEIAAAGPERSLPCFVVIASRWPLSPCEPAPVPVPAAVACVEVQTPRGPVDLIGVHIPTRERSDATLKLETQEGLVERLARLTKPTVLCGDFNSPRAEQADGGVIPFARSEREVAAELALMGLRTISGMTDAYRLCNGYEVNARSWWWKNKHRTDGFRLDHIFVRGLMPEHCYYVHEWRQRGLSDHSALWSDLVLGEASR